MPTISTSDTLRYFYSDTGPARTSDYKTLVVLHGLSFHAGTFDGFARLASDSRPVRIICVNRRHYPGTTQFSATDMCIITSGTDQERSELLEQQGIDLAVLLDALIKQCDLPQSGGVMIAGWSLGTSYMLAIVAAINRLDPEVRSNLQKYVKGFILWDPPSPGLGLPNLPHVYSQLRDNFMPGEKQWVAFGAWASTYYNHGHVDTYESSKINGGSLDQFRKFTIEELSSFIDFSMTTDYDTAMLNEDFSTILHKQTQKALFDREVRSAWKHASFSYLYSDCSPWTFICAASSIREMSEDPKRSECPIKFRCLQNANHLPMLDLPEVTFEAIYDLMGNHVDPTPSPLN